MEATLDPFQPVVCEEGGQLRHVPRAEEASRMPCVPEEK